jgi:hypothetical protein
MIAYAQKYRWRAPARAIVASPDESRMSSSMAARETSKA